MTETKLDHSQSTEPYTLLVVLKANLLFSLVEAPRFQSVVHVDSNRKGRRRFIDPAEI
jgi:hypothetical protein